ncbi:hypothetical protein N9O33_04610 [Gammaproteobacteria bacterium]|nr:hypothetical protein [Gammaproteobacteria bacterium]
MGELIGYIFFAGLVTGAVGAVLGSIVGKGGAGFWLGAFLGPLGWIIVFLLPRDSEDKKDSHSQSAPQMNIPAPPPEDTDLSSDSYRLYLGKKYDIQRNDLFQRFECKEKLFESLDEAMVFADELEARERIERKKTESKNPFLQQTLTKIQNALNERNISLWVEYDENNERTYVLKDKNGYKSLTWDELIEYWQEKIGV